MIKKINILVLLLLILVSIGAVSASEDVNLTSDETNSDILEVSEDNVIDEGVSTESHTINQDNYGNYFDDNGNLIDSAVNSGDTLYIDGTLSDLKFNINKKVTIIGTSTNNLKNSIITLSSGASGSSVSNLNIANTIDLTYGIFLNAANYCTIKDCNIVNKGKSSYCICLANGANHNNVTNNYLKETGVTYIGHGTRSTTPLLLCGAHYNYIENNHLEVDDANGIYLSSFAIEGIASGGNSNFNVIYNNTIHYNVLPTSWAYGIQVMGNDNTIKSNKIIGGYRGISTSGYRNTIIENNIINITGADYNHPNVETGGEYGIVAAANSYVANNSIINAKIISTGAGMSVIDNSVVVDNFVNVTLKGRGIVAAGSNVTIKNNIVFTESGSGIYEKDDGSGLLIDANEITSVSGVGILIEKLNSKTMPKNVTIINNIISTGNKYAIDASGVQAGTSEIDNNQVSGLINSPSGVIDTSKPTYIYKGKTHYITPENIRTYINVNGGLTSEVNDSDILSFSGSFSNEIIYVTKRVKITGDNPTFYNSTFKVTSGGVLIENLTIINRNAERVNAWGIFVNQAPGVRIINNNISVSDPKAAYAVYVLESTDIDVWNNYLASEGDFLTFTLLSYSSEGCNFFNNTIRTVGTGNAYKFSPEKCIDGNELVINGRSYCLDGNELVIDGNRYCLDGNELSINGVSYCLDGNELVIDGTSYCLDGNEFVIDGTSYCIDGNEFVIDGNRYCLDGNELSINGVSYCLDGNEVVINGSSYCLDGNEVVIDGNRYCLDGNELSINGVSYCLDGNEVVINGTSYCLDGNEIVINGTTYCVDGNEYASSGAHVVSEIYQTYGILLLYSSNNLISANKVNVTSKLDNKQSTIGSNSSQNSLVGIDLYFNCHNNTISNNDVFVKANDNYIYGVGVLGYYTGHSAPEGQGATNNSFKGNKITLEGLYCVEGIIIGDESEDTFIEDNVINIKSDCVSYGIYFEMSQNSTVNNNALNLTSQVIYGIIGYESNDNVISNNQINANAYDAYGILFSNGKYNEITANTIFANGTGEKITFLNLDSIGSGNAGVCLKSNSTNNKIIGNEITTARGYAVFLDNGSIKNMIHDNYLVGENASGNNAVNNGENNNVSENYRFVANPSISEISVPYLGTGIFTIAFGSDLDGAMVAFFDADNINFANCTVSKGIASANYKFDSSYDPAQYLFSAKLSKENYKSSTFAISLTVLNSDIVISMNSISVEQGSASKIVAKVFDESGNPIKNAIVKFSRVNSANRKTAIGEAKTNDEGIATLTYNVPASLSEGSHVIVAEVTGISNYNDANVSSTMNVYKKISISGAKNYAVYYGNTVSYKVRILDANGKSAGAGQVVKFTINGKTKTVKTDKNGYASYSVKLSAGKYTISTQCGIHKVSKTITFKPTLTAKNISKKKAKVTTFTVKLVDKKGKILKNKKITFKFKNKKYTANTNNKGIATLSLKNLNVGKYTITSSYGGCSINNIITIKK
ncbi:MAG: right-handed parallel beta-helix repeat-containing protein [Methanobrevibacter sp.]|nr:right-handed parallel beta-helix repeat-containing protein [Methanobrevibacter sp.]